MKKKFLSLLLAISLIVGLLPVMVASAETTATPAATPTTTATTAATTTPTTSPTTPPAAQPTNPALPSAASVSVRLCQTSGNYLAILTAAKGGAPVYATTSDSGVPTLVSGDTAPSDNYVKLEYPKDDLPTLTLKNAKLRAGGNVIDLSAFDASIRIVVEGSSYIESSGKCGIFRASYGDVIIQGPKKLTIYCYSSAIAFDGTHPSNSLILQNAIVQATTIANAAGRAIEIPSGNLTIDSSNLNVVNRAGVALYTSRNNSTDSAAHGNTFISNSVVSAVSKGTTIQLDGNLNISSSTVQLTSDNLIVYCFGNLFVNSSTLAMTCNSKNMGALSIEGAFTLQASNAEIIGANHPIFNGTSLPTMIGHYTVVAGSDKNTTAPYDEAFSDSYRYFYAESLEQPNDPTFIIEEETDSEEDPIDPSFGVSTEPSEETESTEATIATVPTPSLPTTNNSGNNPTLFWILAVLMVLAAGGAAALAIIMFRKNAYGTDEETPEETTEEASAEETPVEEAPAEETPVEETPVEEAPVEETPVEEAPVEETPVEETPVEETPVEEAPVEETPVEETPVEEPIEKPEGTNKKPKKSSMNILKTIITTLMEDDPNE